MGAALKYGRWTLVCELVWTFEPCFWIFSYCVAILMHQMNPEWKEMLFSSFQMSNLVNHSSKYNLY